MPWLPVDDERSTVFTFALEATNAARQLTVIEIDFDFLDDSAPPWRATTAAGASRSTRSPLSRGVCVSALVTTFAAFGEETLERPDGPRLRRGVDVRSSRDAAVSRQGIAKRLAALHELGLMEHLSADREMQ